MLFYFTNSTVTQHSKIFSLSFILMAMQSSSVDFNFDVFISFRGADTRFGFTGNLYKALSDKGIRTFIDDKKLQKGDEIMPSLLRNMDDSRIFIVVFSMNYASSSFCLDELVHICSHYMKEGRLLLPVFYGVEPSHIRHQAGSYGEALVRHEDRFQNNNENMKRLRMWKIALTKAANLSGYHFDLGKDEYEYEFIKKIVTDIYNRINHVLLDVADHPAAGLESPLLLQVKSFSDVDCDDEVCTIGVYGGGGLGKTTLIRAVYNLIADQFVGLCFLHSVRENSMSTNVSKLELTNNNLSDECLPVVLKWFANVTYLDLSGNNLKILPECINRFYLLRTLVLINCKYLKEIRGFPPNLEEFSAIGCKSLTSSSRRMLLSQQIQEARRTDIILPTGREEIPYWFEHQIRGNKISFWFRRKTASITCIILFNHPETIPVFHIDKAELRVNLFVNGYEYNLSHKKLEDLFVKLEDRTLPFIFTLQSDHTYMYDVKLEDRIKCYNRIYGELMSELDEAFSKNEWIYVEIQLETDDDDIDQLVSVCEIQMGIHMLKEKRSMEESVIFTNPYTEKNEDINASLSQFHPTQKKRRFVEVGVSETEILQQQHLDLLSSGMRNLVLTDKKENEQHD